MSNHQLNRRQFLQTSALGTIAAATGVVAAPALLRAQGAPVKVGILHPVSGALSYSGQQGRVGATFAIEEINAAGGIKSLGGAKIEAVLGDLTSQLSYARSGRTSDVKNGTRDGPVRQWAFNGLQSRGPATADVTVDLRLNQIRLVSVEDVDEEKAAVFV